MQSFRKPGFLSQRQPLVFSLLLSLALIISLLPTITGSPIHAQSQNLDQSGTLWAPYLEWNVSNPSYSGNPFDLLAEVTFVHAGSGETRTTQMFYSGSDEWRFRFTATRTGSWTFTSSSSDPELNGLQGTVNIEANPDPNIKGFITTYGNKFARQVGENGELEAFIYNVYQDNLQFPADYWDWENERSLDYIRTYPAEDWATEYLAEARRHGSNSIFIAVANQWLAEGALSYQDHSNENPELLTFDMLERVISTVHSQGGHVQIWLWGDNADSRRWTQTGLPGGINGEIDQRLLRYIAARLGPLPGWTMGYGFDLEEWVSEEETRVWAEYLDANWGWPHLVWARNRSNDALAAISYNAINNNDGPESYEDVLEKLNSDTSRPHLEEERFYHERYGKYDMDTTRRHFWWYTMAGGLGSHWGVHPNYSPGPYPNPEQLEAHRRFWQNRFLLDMAPANDLSDGYVLKDPANKHYVFYKENSTSIRMDLSEMDGNQPAIAIDTRLAYNEIDIGTLSAGEETWNAPYESDWAIAVGSFEDVPPIIDPPDDNPPPEEDTTAPSIVSVSISRENRSQIRIRFSEPISQASATVTDNFSINNGIDVLSASLSADNRQVILETSEHAAGTEYVLTVNNITDLAQPGNTIAGDSQFIYQLLENDLFLPLIRAGLLATTTAMIAGGAWFWWHKKTN